MSGRGYARLNNGGGGDDFRMPKSGWKWLARFIIITLLVIAVAAALVAAILSDQTKKIVKRADENGCQLRECCFEQPCASRQTRCVADVVIAGSGAAGSIVARELADAGYSVVVLEAGRYLQDSPLVYNAFTVAASTSEAAYTESLVTARDLTTGQQVTIHAGRMFGGSDNHNYLYAYYPSDRLLDEEWVPVGGDEWNSTNVREDLKALESVTSLPGGPGGFATETPTRRGGSGKISVMQFPAEPDNNSLFQRIMNRLKFHSPGDTALQEVNDFNTGASTDWSSRSQQFSRFAFTQSGLEMNRSSSPMDFLPKSYLKDDGFAANSSANKLLVYFDATVDRVEWEGDRAAGLRFFHENQERIIYARKWVVLSAGPLNTPRILERSGYGDPSILTELDIPVVHANEEVGRHLHSHPLFFFAGATTANVTSLQSLISHQASLSLLPGANGRRMVQIGCSPFGAAFIGGAQATYTNISTLPPGFKPYSCLVTLFNPHISRNSTIHITSKDPSNNPRIELDTFPASNSTNIDYMRQGIRTLYDTIKDIAGSDMGNTYTVFSPPEWVFANNATLDASIKNLLGFQDHWAGTTMMGLVVDNRLNLIGKKNIKVIDNGISPKCSDSNSAPMARVIGRKGAKFIMQNV